METPSQEAAPAVETFDGGGIIYERYEDGRPKRWLCGHDERGNLTDPPEIARGSAVHYFNREGKTEGSNPTDQVLDEQELWKPSLKPPTTEPRWGQARYGKNNRENKPAS